MRVSLVASGTGTVVSFTTMPTGEDRSLVPARIALVELDAGGCVLCKGFLLGDLRIGLRVTVEAADELYRLSTLGVLERTPAFWRRAGRRLAQTVRACTISRRSPTPAPSSAVPGGRGNAHVETL